MNTPAVSIYLARLPIEFFRWWFWEAPIVLLQVLRYVFYAFVHLFSFPDLFKTFFKPWKNEYREGLVRTAVFIGAFIKSGIIVFDLLIFSLILAVELVVFIGWFVLPILVVFSLYGALFP